MILRRNTYRIAIDWRRSSIALRLTLFGILVSCTKAEIHYPTLETIEGMVQIYPDMSKHKLPASQYHFYNTNTNQEYIVRSCDGSGNFDGLLPVGTYRVIATNISADNVTFNGMDSHETASVYADDLLSTRGVSWNIVDWTYTESSLEAVEKSLFSKLSYLEQPDEVYSTIIEKLIVTENYTIRVEPVPMLLTKHLTLVFSMQDGLDTEVVSMIGVLPGVYPAVHLYSGQGLQIEKSPTVAICFETITDGIERRAHISLFGMYDPAHGEIYSNNIVLNLNMIDGSTIVTTLDLTEILSDVIEKNDGIIPLELSLSLALTKTPIGVGVEVEGWIEGGGDEKETET